MPSNHCVTSDLTHLGGVTYSSRREHVILGLGLTINHNQITLRLLGEIERDRTSTQRQIAGNLGIALGLTNACLRRCVRKGLVKVMQAPANRYLYYLTPAGFSEKSRLTADYLGQSFNFYRLARGQCDALVAEAVGRGWEKIALIGASDLAEVMMICAHGEAVTIVAVIDPQRARQTLAGLPVVGDLAELAAVDGVVITSLQGGQALYDSHVTTLGGDRVLAVPLLGVVQKDQTIQEGGDA